MTTDQIKLNMQDNLFKAKTRISHALNSIEHAIDTLQSSSDFDLANDHIGIAIDFSESTINRLKNITQQSGSPAKPKTGEPAHDLVEFESPPEAANDLPSNGLPSYNGLPWKK